jgi:hypothetical protein
MTQLEIIVWVVSYIIIGCMLIHSEIAETKAKKEREEIWDRINKEKPIFINQLLIRNKK